MGDETKMIVEDSEDKIRAIVHAEHLEKMAEQFWEVMYGEKTVMATTELTNTEIEQNTRVLFFARRYGLKAIEELLLIKMDMKRSRARLGRKEALRGITGESEVNAKAGFRNRLFG